MKEFKNATAVKSTGLSEKEVLLSQGEHGENRLTKRRKTPLWKRYFHNLGDPVIKILLGALAVNLLLLFQNGDWMETAGIGGAVFLATLISTLSEHSSEKAFERLSGVEEAIACRVRREGKIQQVPLCEIVVGDCVLLGAGELIPADGTLFRGELTVDQSSMTGESKEVQKKPFPNPVSQPDCPSALFRGCTVLSGSGEFFVSAVGDATFLGEISKEVQSERRVSPLKNRLAKLAKQISVLGYVAAVLVALAYLFHVFLLDSGMRPEVIFYKAKNLPYLFSKLFHAFTLGLTVIVVAVPEGLPMMIAVVLSSNMKRMLRDQVLVRNPVGIEAAGSMNLLFTDKTGTLTEGKMQVEAFFLPDGRSFADAKAVWKTEQALALLLIQAFSGGEASIGADSSGNACAVGGNATERALLESVKELPLPSEKISSRLLFDSARKYSAVSYSSPHPVTLLLGAPERIFPFCNLTKSFQRQIKARADDGKRVLAVAVAAEPASSFVNGIHGDVNLLCAVSLSDRLRKEAPESVQSLQSAGVHVVMITGDAPTTAKKIATEAKILNSDRPLVLSGEELARISDSKLKELLPRLAVVARALPTDKSRLVRVAQEAGAIVGMTGDGINDAPALRRADIGFAIGSGTQVAKDAGDIVILDNNLASIVKAVLYGRTVFKSIRKFITLQLTMNFSAVGVTMICPFLGIDSPVTVVQMLWINLIMDTLGGLAFAGEAPLASYMKEPPKKREEGILNRYMVNEIFLLGGFTVAVSIFFLKSPLITSKFRPAQNGIYLLTAFFAFFIFASVFNCFNARTDRLNLFAGLGKNRIFLLIMTAVLTIQILFVYLGGNVLRTAPLLPSELLVTFLTSLLVFPAEFLRKLFFRKKGY